MAKPNEDSARLDALLKRTQAAQDSAQRTVLPPPKMGILGKSGKPANESAVGAMFPSDGSVIEELRESAEDLRRGAKLVRDIKTAFGAFKEKVFDPVWNVVSPPFKWAWNGYKFVWNHFAYDKDKETGERTINKTKAAILLTATFAAAVAATPTVPGDMVRYATFDPVKDAAVMMMSMKKHETVYLTKTQEIDPAENIHRVYGCRTPECNASDSVTYNLEPRLSHIIWNTAVKGHPFFQTDRIAAAIPPGLSKCDVTSYGGRFSAAKYFQIFPQMLDVQCTAINTPAPAPAPGG